MLVFGGSQSASLAWDVAKAAGAELGKSEVRGFPDGETYVRILSGIKRRDCAYVQSIRSNDDLVEALLSIEAIKDAGAHQVHAVLPYLAYMRQDKRFKDGEALSAKTVLKMLHDVADSVAVVNCHFLNGAGQAVYNGINFMNLDAMPLLAKSMGDRVKSPLVVAPDKGSLSYAKEAAGILGCDFDHLSKKRLSGTEVAIKPKELNVKGMDVLIIDDIISTGGTIVEAVKVIKGWHPGSVSVGCVHGLFLNGVESFQGVADMLMATNTLNNPVDKVNVAGLIAQELKR
ncbi:MAG: ribose-phosphate diphosphokinase [Candidatus Altiarchaeota archaeon]